MERKQVITIGALALGLLSWRVSGMQQAAGDEVILQTKDQKKVRMSKEDAKLFGTINDLMADVANEKGMITEAIPLNNVSFDTLQHLLRELPWAKTAGQSARDVVKDIPASEYQLSTPNMRQAWENLLAADYLQSPALTERYAFMIGKMVSSDNALVSLAQGTQGYVDLIKAIDARPALAQLIYSYIKDATTENLWIEAAQYKHKNAVESAQFSPDGNKVLTRDLAAHLWDVNSGSELFTFTHQKVDDATFSPNGDRVATAAVDRTIHIWNAQTGEQQQILTGHTSYIKSVSFSPNGTELISASFDKTARSWNISTGDTLILRHEFMVTSASFSPSGTKILTASYLENGKDLYGFARIWTAANGALEHTLPRQKGAIQVAVFSPDSSKVLTSSYYGETRIWDTNTGQKIRDLEGHTSRISAASFSSDGAMILTASLDNTARIWEASSGKVLHILKVPNENKNDAILSAAFSPANDVVATGSSNGMIRIWDAITGRLLRTLKGHTHKVQSVSFSPDGTKIVSASLDQTARIWKPLPLNLEQALFIKMLAKGLYPSINALQWEKSVIESFDPQYKLTKYNLIPQ